MLANSKDREAPFMIDIVLNAVHPVSLNIGPDCASRLADQGRGRPCMQEDGCVCVSCAAGCAHVASGGAGPVLAGSSGVK